MKIILANPRGFCAGVDLSLIHIFKIHLFFQPHLYLNFYGMMAQVREACASHRLFIKWSKVLAGAVVLTFFVLTKAIPRTWAEHVGIFNVVHTNRNAQH